MHEIPSPETGIDLEELAAQGGTNKLKPGARYIALPPPGKRAGNGVVGYGNKRLLPSLFEVAQYGVVVREACGYDKNGTTELGFADFLRVVKQLPQLWAAARGYRR